MHTQRRKKTFVEYKSVTELANIGEKIINQMNVFYKKHVTSNVILNTVYGLIDTSN